MRKTTQSIRQWLAAALCLVGIPASAQFTKTVEQYVNTSYAPVTAQFTMTEVATALGTDPTTLNDALDAWYEDETGTVEDMFFLVDPTDGTTLLNDYTQDTPGGFWVSAEGQPINYGEGCMWYDYIGWWFGEEEGETMDEFAINFGHMPEAITEGATFTPKFVLKYGDKQVTFDITYIVKPIPATPEPSTILRSELIVMGEATVNTHRTDIQGYEATALSVDATGIIAKLGLDTDLFGAQISLMLYTEALDTELGTLKDELTKETTSGVAPGWWYKRSIYAQGEENQGETSPNLGATGYGAEDHIFIEAFAYNSENNAITCNLGQFPGTATAGDSVVAKVYVIYGDKAYRINYQCVFDEAPALGLTEMEKVGESETYELTFYTDHADYQTLPVEIDMTTIATALGCETSEIGMTVLKNEENLWIGEGTAYNGGFWVNEASCAVEWGSNATAFFEPETNGDYSRLNVGVYPSVKDKVGQTYPITIYFTNDTKYYNVKINCNIDEKEQTDQSTWSVVATYPATVQVVASATEYIVEGNQTTYTLTAAQIAEALGSTNFNMYCATHDTIAATGVKYAIHSKYPCTPAPGIYFSAEGRGHGWSGGAVGVCWSESDGAFTVYQIPGVNAAGTTFNAPIYFIDEETGKMVEVSFTVQFVEEIKDAEIVGTESIYLVVNPNIPEGTDVDIDLEKVATALGTTKDELLKENCMKAMESNGLYSDGFNPIEIGLAFNTNGFSDAYDGTIYVMVNNEGTKLNVSTWATIQNDFKATGKFCFELGEKRYEYNVTFVSQELYDGVDAVKADTAKENLIYDLSGRRVMNPTQKGIYIINGKKYVIK